MLQDSEGSFVVYYLGGSTLVLLLIIAIVTYAFLYQKKVIQLKTRLHEEEMLRQQAIFDALQEGEEQERARLAAELHDGIGAKLSGLKMNLEYLKTNTSENYELVSRIFSGVAEALEEVRAVSHDLLPYYYERDLGQLLQNHIDQINTKDGCSYELFVNYSDVEIDEKIKLNCYRIIAELLQNIHKHANATLASVQLSVENGEMEIIVEDNGKGIDRDIEKESGIGLRTIENRVKICKGLMTIDSSGKGTSVIIEIPLKTT